MLFSLFQQQAAIIAVASGLVSASTGQEVKKGLEAGETGLGRNATIKLWAERSGTPSGKCSEIAPYNTVQLAPEVCLSGDYYLNNNFQIAQQPLCPNGEMPIMVFYHDRKCTGDIKYHSTHADPPPETCLWEAKPKYWSVIFRCGVWATLQRGADEHIAAIPPAHDSPLPSDVATNGIVDTWLSFQCSGTRFGPGSKPISVPVDRCLTTPGYSLKLLKPAVCPNGTRALWARFEASRCRYAEAGSKFDLLDLHDEDIGSCQENQLSGSKYSSMAFWCDGFNSPAPEDPAKDEKPKPSAGSVSESACGYGAPFFDHPKTDTCVNLRTNKLKIFSSGVCQNGTSALWAKYSGKHCAGSPESVTPVSDDEIRKCLDVTDTSSFAFWCTGEGLGVTPPTTPKAPAKHNNKGASIFLIVILTFMGVLLLALGGFVAYAFRDQLNAMFRRDGYGFIAL